MSAEFLSGLKFFLPINIIRIAGVFATLYVGLETVVKLAASKLLHTIGENLRQYF